MEAVKLEDSPVELSESKPLSERKLTSQNLVSSNPSSDQRGPLDFAKPEWAPKVGNLDGDVVVAAAVAVAVGVAAAVVPEEL